MTTALPRWTGGRVLASLCMLVAGLLAFHSVVPNSVGNLGSLLEAFLPWLGLAVPVLLGLALLRRSAIALAAVIAPTAAWTSLFGGLLLPTGHSTYDLTALQHNVSEENPDPAGTARALARAGADIIALEELMPDTLPIYEAAFASTYPYHAVAGTVGLWSKHPLSDSLPVNIRPKDVEAEWNRGLRSTVRTPFGEIAVYVAHLPSVRFRLRSGFGSDRRDESAVALGAAIAAERLDKVVLLGDLNSTIEDRGLVPVTSRMTPAKDGFDFSWPAIFPLVRIDHIMTRGATSTEVWTLPATGSDHLPIAARVQLGDTVRSAAVPLKATRGRASR